MLQETAKRLNEQIASPVSARFTRELLTDYSFNPTAPQVLSDSLSQAHRRLAPAQRGRLGFANLTNLANKINRTASDAKQLAAMTAKHPSLARGRLYHQHITGIKTRKHNLHEYQYEHDIWVAETCIRLYKVLTGREPPVEYVLFWLLHDAVEDHGVDHRDIGAFCGRRVADLVAGVTLPSTEQMHRLYPHLPDDRLTLKNHHKTLSLETFVLAQHLLKLIDGLSACRSFASDIKFRRIILSDDESQTDLQGVPQVISRQWMKRNLIKRRAFYKKQAASCLAMPNDADHNPDRIDMRILISCTDILYEKAFHDWQLSISRARPLKTAQRPAVKPRQATDFTTNL